ncbi:MAG: segregation/condensation protein A, partial [Anaerotignaceae bacterium]
TASVYIYKEVSPNIEAFKKEDEITIDQLLDGITFEHIYNIFKEVMKRKEQKVDRVRSSFKSVERDLYTVEEQIEYIKDLLVLSPQVRFVDIFRDNVRKMELVVTFMALLEMIKMKTVSIVQEGIFKDIFITMYTGSDRNEN